MGNSLSKEDIQSLSDYNNTLAHGITYIDTNGESVTKCVSANTAFYHSLRNASSAAQQLAREANGAAVSEEFLDTASKKAALSSKVLGIAMNMALNLDIAAAINIIITGITKLVNKQKELKQSVENVNNAY